MTALIIIILIIIAVGVSTIIKLLSDFHKQNELIIEILQRFENNHFDEEN